MITLTWSQVHAWRLAQQCLSLRPGRNDLVFAATRTGGIQAQVMSAAELALWARVDGLTPQDVQSALWQERTLVKTWAMRGTLHLIAADDLSLFVAARSLHPARNWVGYFNYYGITEAQYEAFLAAAADVLGGEPMTREELAHALAAYIGTPELRDLVLAKGWGTPLKPLAWRGDLCFGPNQGRNVTFVHPGRWLGAWSPVEPRTALQEIARRYLRNYGPATPEDFACWWDGSAGIVPARKLFRSIADELAEVNVEGWRAFALRLTLESIQCGELQGTVRLLPLFDAYPLGLGRDHDPILPRAYKSLVFRPQGWISAVVLVDGTISGTWEYTTRNAQTTVKVRMFAAPTARIRNGIEAETERLAVFLNTRIDLTYE